MAKKNPHNCPLLAGFRVGDSCYMNNAAGHLVLSDAAGGGQYVAWRSSQSEQVTVFNRALVKLASPNPPKKPRSRRSEWVTTQALADALGCEQKHIRETLKDNLFKEGLHYRNINPQAWRPTYRWNLQKCLKDVESSRFE